MADAFTRAKLRLLDRGMRDGRLTAAARLVFWEIIQHVNRVSGDAWPSEERIAGRLGIDVKTVKRALPYLKQYGYIDVVREGRHNTYRPLLSGPPKGDNLSPIEASSVGDNLSGDTGQFVPQTGDKNGPVSSLREPLQENTFKHTTTSAAIRGRARETRERAPSGHTAGYQDKSDDAPRERTVGRQPGVSAAIDRHIERFGALEREGVGDDGLSGRQDDGRIHIALIQELGSEVVDRLYEIDNGRTIHRLTIARRAGPLSASDTAMARHLATRTTSSRKVSQ